MIGVLFGRRKCPACGGSLRRLENRWEGRLYIIGEVILWTGLALLVFGSIPLQYVGGAGALVAIVLLVWNGVGRKTLWKCSSCNFEGSLK